jgi:hypothetical protein
MGKNVTNETSFADTQSKFDMILDTGHWMLDGEIFAGIKHQATSIAAPPAPLVGLRRSFAR